MVRNVLALASIIIISSTLLYVWALSYVRSDKNYSDTIDLHCCLTEDGDFLIIVHDEYSTGALSVDATIVDVEGNELNYSTAQDYYMRDPDFSQVNITFNDRDYDGGVSGGDYFLLPSKENGGVAEIGGEFILIWPHNGDIFGNTTLEANHDYWEYAELKSSWNFIHVDENVTIEEEQVASKFVAIPHKLKPEFQLLFQWSLNDTVNVSILVENVTISNFSVKSSENDEFHVRWKHDFDEDYDFENETGYYCYFKTKYTIQVSSTNTNNTILIVDREVRFIPLGHICTNSFQMNIITLLLSMIIVSGIGFRETRRKK